MRCLINKNQPQRREKEREIERGREKVFPSRGLGPATGGGCEFEQFIWPDHADELAVVAPGGSRADWGLMNRWWERLRTIGNKLQLSLAKLSPR